jgi:hypothetical protein
MAAHHNAVETIKYILQIIVEGWTWYVKKKGI